MTSIEFLFKELWETSKDKLEWHSILEKAKEMHKQEIIDAFKSGLKSPYHQDYTFVTQDNQEGTKSAQYYQETFVSKGSDEMDSNYSQHVTKNHTFKTAFEILQSNLTIADTSEFREIHIPEIIASMEQYKAQLPKQDVDKLGNEDVPKLGYCEISDEEIEKVSATLDYDHISEIVMWEKGARWYREQLKQRQ